jgi:flagellin
MGFSVNTNLDALNTYRNLQSTQNSLSSSLAKLSSGLRINNAGDDAAGLTVATTLGSQVSGLQQASRNAQDGTSVVQTADGALSQAQSLLGRLRDLAVQAANDSNSTSARTAITTEATSIKSELTRLGQSTNFNGKTLLDGTAGSLNFQVGADGNAQSQIGVSFNGTGFDLTAVASALGSTSTATYAVTPGSLTATAYTFKTGNTSVAVTLGTAPTTTAGLADALNANSDFAAAFSATADSSNNLIVSSKLGTTMVNTAPGAGVAAGSIAAATVQFDTAAHAQSAITAIDTQIGNVSTARSTIGALENRFASAVSNISTSITNLTAAKSRITDVDMASEMVNYSRANILAQSGTAMLAQANQAPQLALKLLG